MGQNPRVGHRLPAKARKGVNASQVVAAPVLVGSGRPSQAVDPRLGKGAGGRYGDGCRVRLRDSSRLFTKA